MQRLIFIDNVKCFAIILVVLGHAIQFIDRDGFLQSISFNLVYSFHMPLFMIVSGLFFDKSLDLSFVELVKRRFLNLLLPAFVWSIPTFIFSKGTFVDILIYNVWFLKACFICYVLYYILFKVMGNWALIIAFLVGLLIPLDIICNNLNFMIPSFGVGIIIKDHLDIIVKKDSVIDMLLFFCYIFLFLMWDFDYISYTSPFACLSFTDICIIVCNYIYRMAIAIIATLFIIRLFYRINYSNSILSFIGMNTLGIYVMNILFCNILRKLPMPSMNMISTWFLIFCITIIQLIVYSLFIKYCERFPNSFFILFGKKLYRK